MLNVTFSLGLRVVSLSGKYSITYICFYYYFIYINISIIILLQDEIWISFFICTLNLISQD